jgi:hypothetical protein
VAISFAEAKAFVRTAEESINNVRRLLSAVDTIVGVALPLV